MSAQILINEHEMSLIQERLAVQLMENNHCPEKLLLVGIQRRGADLAQRLAAILEKKLGKPMPRGMLDINLYRDDWTMPSNGRPHIGESSIPFCVDGEKVILVDDVLFSGRTIRAALEALLDYGRPRSVELLVLIDRGHRELPICAQYVGRQIPTEREEHVDVLFTERDGQDCVRLGR